MANDCRSILDNISDQESQAGVLITGSDTVDISGASMNKGANDWQVVVKTTAPALQNPRLTTTVALYLDVDGRSANNAVGGPRLGADTVYAIVHENGAWRITKEVLNNSSNVFDIAPTQAIYQITEQGYIINIPYAELSVDALAYWKTGVAVKDKARLTVDYAPDAGLSCASVLKAEPALVSMDRLAQMAAGAIVIVIIGVVIWKKFIKKKKYDQQTQPH